MVLIVPDPILDLRRKLKRIHRPIWPSSSRRPCLPDSNGTANWLSSGSLLRLLAVEWLAQTAYPDVYDVDLKARFQEFMEVFYEVRLPDQVAKNTLKNR